MSLDTRLRLHHAGLHDLPLPDACLDAAVLVAVLGEVPARELALDEVQRVLKPGGRLVVSEELPDPAYLPAPLVRRWAKAAGLRFGRPDGYSLLLRPALLPRLDRPC